MIAVKDVNEKLKTAGVELRAHIIAEVEPIIDKLIQKAIDERRRLPITLIIGGLYFKSSRATLEEIGEHYSEYGWTYSIKPNYETVSSLVLKSSDTSQY